MKHILQGFSFFKNPKILLTFLIFDTLIFFIIKLGENVPKSFWYALLFLFMLLLITTIARSFEYGLLFLEHKKKKIEMIVSKIFFKIMLSSFIGYMAMIITLILMVLGYYFFKNTLDMRFLSIIIVLFAMLILLAIYFVTNIVQILLIKYKKKKIGSLYSIYSFALMHLKKKDIYFIISVDICIILAYCIIALIMLFLTGGLKPRVAGNVIFKYYSVLTFITWLFTYVSNKFMLFKMLEHDKSQIDKG